MGKRILDMFRRDVVLTVSLVLAVLSCLIAPPSPAYVGYIDFNTMWGILTSIPSLCSSA